MITEKHLEIITQGANYAILGALQIKEKLPALTSEELKKAIYLAEELLLSMAKTTLVLVSEIKELQGSSTEQEIDWNEILRNKS
jgi:hypothetical protein